MLDAFIIERIRREREERDAGIPLRINVPRAEDDPRWDDDNRARRERPDQGEERERGIVIIDFGL